ncbi:MAG: hypothetical protein ACQEQ1_04240 [Pseudomonadota bacterium]
MQTPETGEASPDEQNEQETSHRDRNTDAGAAFADVTTLFTLVGVSVRDTAQLVGLETRLAVKTVFMMMVLGVVFALVLVGVWLSITLIVAAGLYEFTPLGITLSTVAALLVNLGCAKALLMVLKRLARRLAFPETRLAARTLVEDATRTMQPKE